MPSSSSRIYRRSGRKNVAEKIAGEGGEAYALELDVTDPAAWTRVIEHVAKHSKRLDILVNNAGLVLAKYVEETSLEEWQQTLRVNLEGPFLAVKTALPLMRETATRTPFGGSIVNMSSVSGMVGTASLAAMIASYPIGRMGRQEDVANGVLFLASDESAFVTGTELVIDGGRSA